MNRSQRTRLLRGFFRLQLLDMIKQVSCLNLAPFRTIFHSAADLVQTSGTVSTEWSKRKITSMGEGVCRGESTGRVCFNEETTWGTFLKNDMRWVDTKHIFVKHGPDDTDQNEGSKRLFLEELSVAELRQEAKKRGHRSVGIKRDLVERLMSNEPPVATRPRRRKHRLETTLPEGYMARQASPRPRALHPYTRQLRVLSWNVNGIRAQLDKEEGRKALRAVIAQEKPHVLGLQEIRISSRHSRDEEKQVRPIDWRFAGIAKSILPDYEAVWLSSFPPARQGYAGTALLLRKRREWDTGCPTLLNVRGGIGHREGDLEGRVTTAEFDVAFVVNVYTPNSGAGLKRLTFRTSGWDEKFAAYVSSLEEIKPVVVIGDLNVAHEDKDFYNPEQRRTRKIAGTTPEERSSFARNLLGRGPPPSCLKLSENGAHRDQDSKPGGTRLMMTDTFREMHKHTTGAFTYWSVRARNRSLNRGMRLDYCLASRALVDGAVGSLHDAYILDQDTLGVSDHCPVGLVIRLGDHHAE